MKGKKLLSLLMCTLLAAGALGACGQEAGESGGESRNQSSEVKESSGTESQEAAQGEGTNEEQTWQVTLAVPVNGPVDEKNETLDYLSSGSGVQDRGHRDRKLLGYPESPAGIRGDSGYLPLPQ